MRGKAGLVVCGPMAAALLAIAIPQPSRAFFERVATSARSTAMGGAFVGLANDPAALFVNPAGLAENPAVSFLSSFHKPYGLADLNEGFAGAAYRTPFGVIGGAWHYLGLREAVSENLVTIAFARDLVRNTQDASLSLGASIDLAAVSAATLGTSETAVTGGLGVLLRPFPVIGIGYSVRNLVESEFDLEPGRPGGATLRRVQAWGISYRWHQTVTLTAETRQSQAGDQPSRWQNRGGLEIVAHPMLRVRGGMDGRHATGGFGVTVRGIAFDVAVLSHERLGTTYVFSLGYARGGERKPDVQ